MDVLEQKAKSAYIRASQKTSIGDMETQLAFLVKELKQSYCSVYQILRTAGSVAEASNAVFLQFERPADQSTAVQKKRASYGQNYYEKFVGGTKSMSRKRSEIVAQAQSWIGCKEADGSHKRLSTFTTTTSRWREDIRLSTLMHGVPLLQVRVPLPRDIQTLSLQSAAVIS